MAWLKKYTAYSFLPTSGLGECYHSLPSAVKTERLPREANSPAQIQERGPSE